MSTVPYIVPYCFFFPCYTHIVTYPVLQILLFFSFICLGRVRNLLRQSIYYVMNFENVGDKYIRI